MPTKIIETDINICCPMCGSRLSYGLEELVMHVKVINPKNGELQKRTKKKSGDE